MQLQSRWFAGEFGSEFISTDGQRVQVRDFGEWNAGAGPDFRLCTVLIDGVAHSGDIELDPDLRDWERRQHGANADYNRVVLHLSSSRSLRIGFSPAPQSIARWCRCSSCPRC